jgi:hypothetical protein
MRKTVENSFFRKNLPGNLAIFADFFEIPIGGDLIRTDQLRHLPISNPTITEDTR